MYNNYLDAFFGKIFILFSIFSILPTAVSKNKSLNYRIKSKYEALIEILPCFPRFFPQMGVKSEKLWPVRSQS